MNLDGGIYNLINVLFEMLKKSLKFILLSILGVFFVNTFIYMNRTKKGIDAYFETFLASLLIQLYVILLFIFNFMLWYILGGDIFSVFIKIMITTISLTYISSLIVIYSRTDNGLFLAFKNAFILTISNLAKSVMFGLIVIISFLVLFNISSLLVIVFFPGFILYIQNRFIFKYVCNAYEMEDSLKKKLLNK